MSTEGTRSHEEERVDRGPTGSSSPGYSDGSNGTEHGLDEANSVHNLINLTPSLTISLQSALQINAGGSLVIGNSPQQQRVTSDIGIELNLPLAEEERAFRASSISHEQEASLFQRSQNGLPSAEQFIQLRTLLEMARNYGDGGPLFPADAPAAAQMPPVRQPYPHNPVGASIGALPPFPMPQWANNPNWQPQNQLSNGHGMMEIQFEGLVSPVVRASSYYPVGGSSNNQTDQLPITPQQELLGLHLNPRDEMEDSSTRNVRMRMTLQDNGMPSAELQPNSWLNLTAGRGSENPSHPPRPVVENKIYDTKYEAMGLPVDPYLRLFMAQRHRGMLAGNIKE